MNKLLLAAVAASLAGQASAALVTRTYHFEATNPGAAALAGSVTVSFDPAVTAENQRGAVVRALGVPAGGEASFSYHSDADTLAIAAGRGAERDFTLVIRGASADAPTLGGVLSYAGGDDRAITRRVTVTRTDPPARLPEPATWAMLVMGFGLIGWAARRRQRRSETAFTERLRRIAAGELD